MSVGWGRDVNISVSLFRPRPSILNQCSTLSTANAHSSMFVSRDKGILTVAFRRRSSSKWGLSDKDSMSLNYIGPLMIHRPVRAIKMPIDPLYPSATAQLPESEAFAA